MTAAELRADKRCDGEHDDQQQWAALEQGDELRHREHLLP